LCHVMFVIVIYDNVRCCLYDYQIDVQCVSCDVCDCDL